MILKRAIKAFLARPRKDWRRFKAYGKARLRRWADSLPVEPPIWSVLNMDQRICFIVGALTGRFAFWADTGTGKTLLSIALMRYFRREGRCTKRYLVLVPSKLNKAEWAREIKKWSPKLRHLVLKGSSLAKWEKLDRSDAVVVIETYAGLVRMVTDFTEVKKKGKPTKTILTINRKLLKKLVSNFDGLFMDESIRITVKKRHGSLMHRICFAISKKAEIVYALNGTPHGRDPTDLWGQLRVVDLGVTLGETLGLFRAVFFTETKNYWGGADHKFNKKMAPELNRILANGSIRIEADESTLPPVVPIKKVLDLPEDAVDVYQRAKEELMAARGNFREMENAFLRMRQISSGFVGYYDDELGTRAKFQFRDNPKLDSVLDTVAQVHEKNKIIIYHDFVHSGGMIAAELKRMDVGFVRLWGHKGEPEEILERFDDDKRVRVFILNNSEASGLNLQTAKYGLFYESPVPVITRKQAVRRLERQYSKHDRVFIYDFVVRGTFDQRILDFHAEGRDLFEAIIEGRDPRRVIG